jgi:hypothetical protein
MPYERMTRMKTEAVKENLTLLSLNELGEYVGMPVFVETLANVSPRQSNLEYIQANVYEEVINDIERRVNEACGYMKKNPPRWISDALDTLEELSKDLY